MAARRVPGPGEVRVRLEYTDSAAAAAVADALRSSLGDDAVHIDATRDRSRPHRRRRDPAPGLTHVYTTITIRDHNG